MYLSLLFAYQHICRYDTRLHIPADAQIGFSEDTLKQIKTIQCFDPFWRNQAAIYAQKTATQSLLSENPTLFSMPENFETILEEYVKDQNIERLLEKTIRRYISYQEQKFTHQYPQGHSNREKILREQFYLEWTPECLTNKKLRNQFLYRYLLCHLPSTQYSAVKPYYLLPFETLNSKLLPLTQYLQVRITSERFFKTNNLPLRYCQMLCTEFQSILIFLKKTMQLDLLF